MIKPLNNHVLVEIIKDDGTEDGFVIHNKDNVVAETGKVLAVPDNMLGDLHRPFSIGDTIYFKTYSLITVPKTKYNEELNFVITDEILGVQTS